MSKLLAIINKGSEFLSLSGNSINARDSYNLSIFTPCCAETGIISLFSAIVPFMNCFIS